MSDKLAEVIDFFENGAAQVQFHGEEDPSVKEYPFLSSYIPALGDTVFMKQVGDSYVIMGSIRYQEAPVDNKNLEVTSLKVKNNLNAGTITSTTINDINTAIAGANTAIEAEVTARTNADNGLSTRITTAQSRADTGVSNAASAQSTANTAASNASSAQSTANTAKSTADAVSSDFTAFKNNATLWQLKVRSNVGFYDTAPTYKRSVSTISTSATLEQAVSAINSIVNALKAYGLF